MAHRLPSWLVGLLLAAPLLALTAWVVGGFAPPAETTPRGVLPGLAVPEADLPLERLEERVNGAADALRADGCRRLLYWRFEDPAADAEVLVFRSAEQARAALEEQAGADRTPGPGDEAQVGQQSIYFRRGPVLVRMFRDPGVEAEGLVERASEIDRALENGGPL